MPLSFLACTVKSTDVAKFLRSFADNKRRVLLLKRYWSTDANTGQIQKHCMNDTECRDRSIDDNSRSNLENRGGFSLTEILDSTEHKLMRGWQGPRN